ncbi:glutathione S-transferase family protein [Labrenzia sp. 011]|uniref:glutathione S-transferase family protein n=1 Tax=Labrenzia sp. 011 TaxID=2171494 RepID=UPI000D51507C|nr:glutathione S-transferase family protein [Labrenzia sp. 011]PVB61663.1 glutathione S-transferase family protein [Labrenzia sp. 011]
MKLYTSNFSPNCRRVEAVLHHLGLHGSVDIRRPNMVAGEHRSDEIRAVNPNMKLPTLVAGDMNLWEANPIMIYLCDRAGAEEFCPTDLKSRFEILRWMSWEVQHYNRELVDILWETVLKGMFGAGAPDQDKVDVALENYCRFAQVLEDRLGARDFVLGDRVTVADFAVGASSGLAMLPGAQVPLDDYPNIKAWYLRLESLPAWAKTAPENMAEAAA